MLEGIEDLHRSHGFDCFTKGLNEVALRVRAKTFDERFNLSKKVFDGV